MSRYGVRRNLCNRTKFREVLFLSPGHMFDRRYNMATVLHTIQKRKEPRQPFFFSFPAGLSRLTLSEGKKKDAKAFV